MKSPDVAVIDYGVGNLLSVRRALEHWGADVTVTADPGTILNSSRVILPGVGAFSDGMAELRNRGLDAVVREAARKRTPILGICLGMQMLLDESEEFGVTPGLGLIPGRAVQVPNVTAEGESQKIPHIGWSSLVLPGQRTGWERTILQEAAPGEAVYFVHSFMADPASAEHRLADTLYGGVRVCAAIARDNIFGCQFHAEKSGTVGLKILKTFLAQ